MKQGTKPPRSYFWFFLGLFFLAEAMLIGLDLYYMFAEGDAVSDFLFDWGLISIIILALVLLTYFTMRRILVRSMDSERRFKEVADLLPEGLIEVSAGGTVTYANDLAIEWFGYSDVEVENGEVNVVMVISAEERARAIDNMAAVMGGEALRPRTYTATRKDGSQFPVLISSSPIEKGGQTLGVRAVLTDISDEITAQERLRESESKYRELFESSIDAILVVSLATGKITEANHAFLEMIGYDADELAEKTYAELTPDRWHAKEMEIIRDQVSVRDYSDEYEKEIVRKDGDILPVSVRRWLIKDKGGRPIGMWTILRDITDKKLREEQMERINQELVRYAHTVSHDLKGPIHEVTMAGETVQMLLERPQTEQVKGYLADSFEVMRHGLNRANNLIDDMLVLAETGQQPSEVDQVEVSDTVREILRERAADISMRNIDVQVDDDLGKIFASPTHIYQIFSNLLKNAILYGDSVQPVIEIRRLEGTGDGAHRFLVKDNGAGVPESLLDRIFIPFTKGMSGDSGIGLSIVQRLTEVYGGRIKVYNDPGACFEFTLFDYH
jgi:PAS domain S-box-containing protein